MTGANFATAVKLLPPTENWGKKGAFVTSTNFIFLTPLRLDTHSNAGKALLAGIHSSKQ